MLLNATVIHVHEEGASRKLQTAAAAIIVTADHRFVVPRGDQQQTIPASHLRQRIGSEKKYILKGSREPRGK